MRVAFAVYPSIAHLYPVVPCAWALQSAGHEVRIASFAGFAGSIAATGLTPVSLGDPEALEARLADDAVAPKGAEEVEHFASVLALGPAEREYWYIFYQYLLMAASDYLRLDRPEVDDLVGFARSWKPDLVIWDPTMPAGAVAARACGAAHARLGLGMDVFAWSLDRLAERRSQVRAAGLAENPLAALVAPVARRYGVEVDDELLVGQWTIDPSPPGLSLPTSTSRIPVRWVPYSGGSVFQPWLYERPDRPRVGLSLGESTRRFIKGDWDRTPKLMEAVADLDIEVVATLNSLQLDGLRTPDNVRTIDWVPLTQLLPTCSALIHHGGMGTLAAASAFRVPQLVCDTEESNLIRMASHGADEPAVGAFSHGLEFGVSDQQPDGPRVQWLLPAKKLEATPCANYVIEQGAGVRLNHQAQSVDEMREQILHVLNEPAYIQGAAAIHEAWLATPSPNDIVATLESLPAGTR